METLPFTLLLLSTLPSIQFLKNHWGFKIFSFDFQFLVVIIFYVNSRLFFVCDFSATINFEEFMAFGDSLFSGFSDL